MSVFVSLVISFLASVSPYLFPTERELSAKVHTLRTLPQQGIKRPHHICESAFTTCAANQRLYQLSFHIRTCSHVSVGLSLLYGADT